MPRTFWVISQHTLYTITSPGFSFHVIRNYGAKDPRPGQEWWDKGFLQIQRPSAQWREANVGRLAGSGLLSAWAVCEYNIELLGTWKESWRKHLLRLEEGRNSTDQLIHTNLPNKYLLSICICQTLHWTLGDNNAQDRHGPLSADRPLQSS